MDWIKINENEAWTDFLLHEYTYRDDVKRKLDNLAKDYWHSSFDSLVETCTADSTRISEIICKAFKVARWGFYDELRNMCPEWYKGKLQLDVLSNLRIPPGFNDWYDRSKKTGLIREIAKAYENNDPCLESRTGNESKEKVRCHLNTCIKLFQKDVDYLIKVLPGIVEKLRKISPYKKYG